VNRVSSVLGAMAVVAIAVVFIVQFRPATGAQLNAGPTCAAEVRGQCIPSTHFFASLRLLAPRNADADRLRAMNLRSQVLDGLIDRVLLADDAKRLGITVSDEDISRELSNGRAHVSLPAERMEQLAYALGIGDDLVRYLPVKNRTTKKFDAKVYEKEVRAVSKMSPADFREYQRSEILAERMRDLVRARVQVSDTEAFDEFARKKSTATISYVKLDRSFYVDTVLDMSQKAIEAWSEKNKEELDKAFEGRKAQYLPECRALRHVLARVDASTVDPEGAKAKAKARIEAAKKRLDAGEDFATVARDMSDDPSAARGGDLGCVTKGKMVKPFEDAAWALAEGKVSDVVESEFGFHIVKLDAIAKDAEAEKRGRAQTAFELYASHEAERLAAEGAKELLGAVRGGKTIEAALETYMTRLSSESKVHDAKDAEKKDDKSAESANRERHGASTFENHPDRPRVETSLPFTSSGDPIPGVRSGSSAAQIAFGLAKAGDVPNDILPLDNGYALLQLKEKAPATKEQWEKDRTYFVSAMRAAKQQDALAGYVKHLRASVEIKQNNAIVGEPKSKDEDKNAPPPAEEE